MQTEEVVPCAQSTGLDELATTDRLQHLQQPEPQSSSSSLLFCPPTVQQLHHHLQSYNPLVSMAVKQEPQEHDDERARQSSTLSAQMEHEDVQPEQQHKCQSAAASGQSSPEFEVPPVVQPTATCQLQNGCKKPVRKSRWKLKFHHQALPPEYLDHYEAALAQEAALNNNSSTPTTESQVTMSPLPVPQPPAPPPPASVDVQSWLQRLAAMQSEIYSAPPQTQLQPTPQMSASRRSVITSTQHMQQPQQPRPPMKYSDLPYMGEITLDNSKPRRGRKPKKADICHLIYKNYGTILPGTPGLEDRSKLPQERLEVGKEQPSATTAAAAVSAFQRTDIQNRISSLLEKRLTQERRALESAVEQEEPMNLCIRDLNLLKIRLGDRQPSVFGSCNSRSEGSSDAEDVEFIGPSENDQESKGTESNSQMFGSNDNSESNGVEDSTSKPNPNMMYWPNTNVFLHPVALQSQFMYYQKMAQEKGIPPISIEMPKEQQQRIVPKSIYSMLEANKPSAEPVVSEPSTPSPRPKRNSAASQSQSQPTKRKRSAIFIPPMPTENNNNPATEVSICKFKFTGGAKPSLQEKKSLSVDSGGNFRYYSGTGDKSMRGYEFFPREALQQPANQTTNNNTGAFLNAAAERTQPATTPIPRPVSVCSVDDSRNKKRKTRKSMQREKLEQTFKEKGFLIQTQQLESAEGATYCKFRQLRKFTRYLFRSWKDYLPGELTESDAAAAAAAQAAAANELQHSSYVEPSLN